MAELKSPFRYDFVGSFLRPQHLKEARAQFKAGEIDHAALTAVENEEITRLIEKQKRAGYHAITDGEFRRSYWHLDFMWGFHGIEEVELDHGYFFHGEETTHGSIKVSGKISGENHPFVEHYKFVKQFEDENCIARQTMPAPAQLLAELYREDNGKNTDTVYPDHEQLIQDIAVAYRTVIQELYAAGCRNIQFDDCTWGMIGDPNYQNFLKESNTKVEDVAAEYLRLNNLALENRPEGLTITTHVCRGNYHSTWASEGDYFTVAPFLLAQENVDAFYLEFAAVTRKQTGRGTLYYVGCGLEEKITKLLMEQVMRDWHFQMVPSEESLEIVTRGNEKQKVTMYINHNAEEVTYGDMTLAPFACKILEA